MISNEEFEQFLFGNPKQEPGNKYYVLNSEMYYSIIENGVLWKNLDIQHKVLVLIHFRIFPLKVSVEETEIFFNLLYQSGFIENEQDIQNFRIHELCTKFN